MYVFKPRNLISIVGIAFFAAVMVFGDEDGDGESAPLVEVASAAERAAPRDVQAQAGYGDRVAPVPQGWAEEAGLAEEGPVASARDRQGRANPAVRTRPSAQARADSAGYGPRNPQQLPQPAENVRRQSAPLNQDGERDALAALAEDVRGAIDP
jgi:hypothetical protein